MGFGGASYKSCFKDFLKQLLGLSRLPAAWFMCKYMRSTMKWKVVTSVAAPWLLPPPASQAP